MRGNSEKCPTVESSKNTLADLLSSKLNKLKIYSNANIENIWSGGLLQLPSIKDTFITFVFSTKSLPATSLNM